MGLMNYNIRLARIARAVKNSGAMYLFNFISGDNILLNRNAAINEIINNKTNINKITGKKNALEDKFLKFLNLLLHL